MGNYLAVAACCLDLADEDAEDCSGGRGGGGECAAGGLPSGPGSPPRCLAGMKNSASGASESSGPGLGPVAEPVKQNATGDVPTRRRGFGGPAQPSALRAAQHTPGIEISFGAGRDGSPSRGARLPPPLFRPLFYPVMPKGPMGKIDKIKKL